MFVDKNAFWEKVYTTYTLIKNLYLEFTWKTYRWKIKTKLNLNKKNLEQIFYKRCVNIPLGHRKQFTTISCAENANQHYSPLKWLKLRLRMSSVCKTSGNCNFHAHTLLVGALSCTNIVHSQESVGDSQMCIYPVTQQPYPKIVTQEK